MLEPTEYGLNTFITLYWANSNSQELDMIVSAGNLADHNTK